MRKSKVYFSSLKTKPGQGLLKKLGILLTRAGIDTINFKNKYTAIKMHFGEYGNLAFIRPNYISTIVSRIKQNGGKAFLTDTGTLYTGQRANALDHLDTAMANGFTPATMGCQLIIADGLLGMDFTEINVDKKHIKKAKIGRVLADADIIISCAHFKGHEQTGFGGTIKNIGMGGGSRGGKLEMHSASKPTIYRNKCRSCYLCLKYCSHNAIVLDSANKAEIIADKCIGCGQCIAMCQDNAVQPVWDASVEVLNEKIAEYALAVVNGKPNFHINFIMDVSPLCDCWPNNDIPIVPDIGIVASFDPVACDKASVDLVNRAPIINEAVFKDKECKPRMDKFTAIHSKTNWKACLKYCQDLGLGSMDYELIQTG